MALVYQRRRQAEDSKQLLYDEDDIREHINKVNIEGGGEEDNVCFNYKLTLQKLTLAVKIKG